MDGRFLDLLKELTRLDELLLAKGTLLILEHDKHLPTSPHHPSKKVHNPHRPILPRPHLLTKNQTNIGLNGIVPIDVNGKTLLGIAGLFEQLDMLLEVDLVVTYGGCLVPDEGVADEEGDLELDLERGFGGGETGFL